MTEIAGKAASRDGNGAGGRQQSGGDFSSPLVGWGHKREAKDWAMPHAHHHTPAEAPGCFGQGDLAIPAAARGHCWGPGVFCSLPLLSFLFWSL